MLTSDWIFTVWAITVLIEAAAIAALVWSGWRLTVLVREQAATIDTLRDVIKRQAAAVDNAIESMSKLR